MIKRSYQHIPLSDSDQRALLVDRPPAWEYMLLASTLIRRLESLEPKWFDFQLRFVNAIGPVVSKESLANVVRERLDIASTLVYHLNNTFSSDIQERAFGLPGEHGDPELIVHLGIRMIDGYGSLLQWSEDVRSLRVPRGAEKVRLILSEAMGESLLAYRVFVSDFAERVEQIPEMLSRGQSVNLNLSIRLTLPDTLGDNLAGELRKLLGTSRPD